MREKKMTKKVTNAREGTANLCPGCEENVAARDASEDAAGRVWRLARR
jgi:hypothetical protein